MYMYKGMSRGFIRAEKQANWQAVKIIFICFLVWASIWEEHFPIKIKKFSPKRFACLWNPDTLLLKLPLHEDGKKWNGKGKKCERKEGQLPRKY